MFVAPFIITHQAHPRLVRVGPAKRKGVKHGSDTDNWEGGMTYHSDFDESQDEDLKEYLQTNANFLAQMCSTGGFSVARLFKNN